jgi:AraC family transcriptional regulator of adaptative response / DNA-3-methyladenine glycosylase II
MEIMLNLPIPTIQKARIARDPRFDGLFFIGVKTTGIFCRPICKARMPLEKNVAYYNNAITAMNAGFRPCLMCRPDSAPGSYAWKGVETTVERGVKLLSAHLSLSIAEIADKLGISTRYFTRLFELHLQISPKRYQLLSRLLFAKQLLHESGLPIERIAQACGFNAAKPLQHHMKLNTGLTPSQIRRSNTAKTETEASKVTIHLSYRPPYQWQHIRDFFKRRQIESNEKVENDSISKVLRFGENRVLFQAVHQPEKNRFEVTFSLTDLRLLKVGIAALKKMLDLNCEPNAIHEALIQAGMPPQSVLNGLRLPGIIDKFEAGCRAIIGQQVSVKAAIGQLNLLQNTLSKNQATNTANKANKGPGSLKHAPRPDSNQVAFANKGPGSLKYAPRPDSNQVAFESNGLIGFVTAKQVAEADLSFLKMPNARKETLKAFAQFMLEQPDANIDEWLNIKGIGAWTVNYVTMRTSDSPDIFLATDLVVKKQIEQLADRQIGVKQELAAPWRSYLTLSLWNLPNIAPYKPLSKSKKGSAI